MKRFLVSEMMFCISGCWAEMGIQLVEARPVCSKATYSVYGLFWRLESHIAQLLSFVRGCECKQEAAAVTQADIVY